MGLSCFCAAVRPRRKGGRAKASHTPSTSVLTCPAMSALPTTAPVPSEIGSLVREQENDPWNPLPGPWRRSNRLVRHAAQGSDAGVCACQDCHLIPHHHMPAVLYGVYVAVCYSLRLSTHFFFCWREILSTWDADAVLSVLSAVQNLMRAMTHDTLIEMQAI